ncbi:hypothetical protein DPMN_186321 [Dreissena polymorpha]|uniref:Uncharacterized protein n=1 Tax=Dreissena polymorpha TaxID=45954 RepID=A0A9D4I9H7_DREPO|nr:hypothetical protein DPMN_186321 [Dreissena polymorpha]
MGTVTERARTPPEERAEGYPVLREQAVPKEVAGIRLMFVPRMKEARSKCKIAGIAYGTLFVDGKFGTRNAREHRGRLRASCDGHRKHNSAAFNPLIREPCAKASRIHLTVLPADIDGLTETPRRLLIVYNVTMFRNATWLRSYIRSLDISAFRNFRQINCWLGIPVSDHVFIHVVVKDSDIDFKTIYTCLPNSTLIHLAHVRILRVTFTPSNGNASSLVIYTHITYKYSEFYCSVHKVVRLFCNLALTTESQSQVKDPEVDSFGTF